MQAPSLLSVRENEFLTGSEQKFSTTEQSMNFCECEKNSKYWDLKQNIRLYKPFAVCLKRERIPNWKRTKALNNGTKSELFWKEFKILEIKIKIKH